MALCGRQEAESSHSRTDAPRGTTLCPRRWGAVGSFPGATGAPTDRPVVLSLEDGMCWRGFGFFKICKSDHMVSTELLLIELV